MTQEQIEELKWLAEAATPGPWFCDPFKWAETIVCGAGEEIDHVFIGGPICETRNPLGIPGADPRCEQMRKANSQYIAAANPAAVLELIADVERLREDADDLTIALESSEKALKDSRANDYTATGYLADCRVAVGDNGKRMLPEFVEYLRQLKHQRDELLAALRDVVGWVPGREKWHTNAPIEAVERARTAIAKAEADKK